MVPEVIFDKVWREGNFLIPVDKGVRIELRQRLEGFLHTGVMARSEHKEVRAELRARIAAIEAYENELLKY